MPKNDNGESRDLMVGDLVEVTISRSRIIARYHQSIDRYRNEEVYESEAPRRAKVVARKSWGDYGIEWVVVFDGETRERYMKASELRIL